jgi:hypothetical protein
MGRVPVLTDVRAGDIIVATNSTGVSGATTFGALRVPSTSGKYLGASAGVVTYVNPRYRSRISFTDAAGPIAAGVYQYTGQWAGDTNEGTYYTRHVIPAAGVLRNLYVQTSQAPGAGKLYTFQIKVNGATSSLTTTIADTSQANANTTANVIVAASDYITLLTHVHTGATGINSLVAAVEYEITEPY